MNRFDQVILDTTGIQKCRFQHPQILMYLSNWRCWAMDSFHLSRRMSAYDTREHVNCSTSFLIIEHLALIQDGLERSPNSVCGCASCRRVDTRQHFLCLHVYVALACCNLWLFLYIPKSICQDLHGFVAVPFCICSDFQHTCVSHLFSRAK